MFLVTRKEGSSAKRESSSVLTHSRGRKYRGLSGAYQGKLLREGTGKEVHIAEKEKQIRLSAIRATRKKAPKKEGFKVDPTARESEVHR